MDEYLDVVDANDQVIGKELRSKLVADKRSDYRVVNVFLKNSEGKLWIPRRTAHKKMFPSALDFATGGHVESGETYDQTFQREVMEELAIDVTQVPVRELGIATPHGDNVSSFMKVYEITSDAAPQFNQDDFTEYFWLTPQETIDWIAKGEPAKDDIPKLIRKFYIGSIRPI